MKHHLIKHIDGIWHTSNHLILNIKCQIKMRDFSGCKIHIWDRDNNKIVKTFRYNLEFFLY
jgi:hypothetical protein